MIVTVEQAWYVAILALTVASVFVWAQSEWGHNSRFNLWHRLLSACVAAAGLAVPIYHRFDELCDQSFAAHMAEHGLFIYAIPIALLVARPIALVFEGLRSLSPTIRYSLAHGLKTIVVMAEPFAIMGHPASAFILSSACLWLWHIPALYDYALQHRIVHALEHLSFLLTFLLYWRPLVERRFGVVALKSNLCRAIYIIAGGMQGGLLGALITLSNHVDYTAYLFDRPASAAAVLADQRIGGAIMWFSGPLFYAIAAALVMRNPGTGPSREHLAQ